MKTGRNDPCPCGSGKKYKQCCLGKEAAMPLYQKLLIALLALILVGGLLQVVSSLRNHEPGAGGQQGGKVWSEEHQHWH